LFGVYWETISQYTPNKTHHTGTESNLDQEQMFLKKLYITEVCISFNHSKTQLYSHRINTILILTAICTIDITKMNICLYYLLLYVLNTFCCKLLEDGDSAETCRS